MCLGVSCLRPPSLGEKLFRRHRPLSLLVTFDVVVLVTPPAMT